MFRRPIPKPDFSIFKHITPSETPDDDDSTEDYEPISTSHPPPAFWRYLRCENPSDHSVTQLISDSERLSGPLPVISLLCRLITVAPVITGYLKLLLHLPEIDSFDVSSEFTPDLFHRLMNEFFQHNIASQKHILTLIQKGIPIDCRLHVHNELFCFISQVLALTPPGKIACASFVILSQLLPYEEDEEKAVIVLQTSFAQFWKSCDEFTELTLNFEVFLKNHQSAELITIEICAILLQCVCENFCVCRILAMFENILRWSERNGNVLIEAGMIEIVSQYCVRTTDSEIHRKFMIIIIAVPNHHLRNRFDVLDCVKWMMDETAISAKIYAVLAYLKMLGLMSVEKRREDLSESRIMTIMQVVLCGTNGEILDLVIGIHGLVANDEIIQKRMWDLGVEEILNEVEYEELDGKVGNAMKMLMNAFTGTS
jgi:hypothetical protein